MNYIYPTFDTPQASATGSSLSDDLCACLPLTDCEQLLLDQIEECSNQLQSLFRWYALLTDLQGVKTVSSGTIAHLQQLHINDSIPVLKNDGTTWHLNQEGIIAGTVAVFKKIWEFIVKLWNSFRSYIGWYCSFNARYQIAIRRLQQRVATGEGTSLPLNMNMTVMTYSEFKYIMLIAQDLVEWSRSLNAADVAKRLVQDTRIYRDGIYIEPTYVPLNDTLGRKGWTVTNTVDGMAAVMKLLYATENAKTLERTVERSVVEIQTSITKAQNDRNLTEELRKVKVLEIRKMVHECEMAVKAVKSIRGLVGKLAVTIITVGNQLKTVKQ